MTTTAINREDWLNKAVNELSGLFAEAGYSVPAVKVSVGWPGGGNKRTRIGECWTTAAAKDGVNNLFVSPQVDSPTKVLEILAHELIHAIDDCQHGHRGPFVKMGKAIGLKGPWTATTASPELAETLCEIAAKLGDYPHGAMSVSSAAKKQSTRMLKVECLTTGYTLRTTRKWLEQYGAPICPCCQELMDIA